MTAFPSSGGTITIGSRTYATTSSMLTLHPEVDLAYGQIRRLLNADDHHFLVLGAVTGYNVWNVVTFRDGCYLGIFSHSAGFLMAESEIIEQLA